MNADFPYQPAQTALTMETVWAGISHAAVFNGAGFFSVGY